eukprot:jgi/Astpho2/8721/Aster-05285
MRNGPQETNGQVHDVEANSVGDAAEEPANGQNKSTVAAYAEDKPLLGLGTYCLSSIFLATMLVAAKILGQKKHYPTFQLLLARGSIIMIFALIACARQKVNPFGKRRGLLAIRGLFGVGAITCYLFAITNMELPNAMVLTFLAPLWVALLSPIILKERLSWATIAAIPVCLVGVILITQPPALGMSDGKKRSYLGMACACGQAFFSACAKMCVRELRKTDTANVSVFYLSFSSTVFATIALTVSWLTGRAGVVIPSAPVDWGLFALVGTTGYGTQICMTIALKYCKAAPAIAMSYLSIVWGLLGGYFFFHEVPNRLSLAGAVIICSCTFLLGVVVKRQPAAGAEGAAEKPAVPGEAPADTGEALAMPEEEAAVPTVAGGLTEPESYLRQPLLEDQS